MPNNNTNGQTVLEHRPEARGYRVEQLLKEAQIGKLRIPSFQRPLRWRSKNVIDLFDSMRRGFPIGELLLSRDHAPATTVHFGPVTIAAAEQHSALWVVDGQQRITAMVASLSEQHGGTTRGTGTERTEPMKPRKTRCPAHQIRLAFQ